MEHLLPPLSGEQFSSLESDILESGCYAPIIVNEDMTVIDGHNRFRICEKHGLPYKMLVFSFTDLLEAKQWALDTQKPTWNNFTYRTYKKEGAEVCTAHYIRECVLDEVVLEDLRRVTAMAREHTREFAEYIGGRQSAEIQREIRRLERELTALRKRGSELDAIFKKLYEDRVLGHISVEQFQTLSGGYTEEQEKLAAEIPAKEAAIQKLRDTVSSTDGFITKARRYTDITELTPELLRLFIQKIVVHEKSTKWSKKAMQTVEIHYSDIGFIGGDMQQDKESPRQEISA